MMAAVAIDQDAAHAHRAHLAERNLLRPTVGVRGVGQSETSRHRNAAPAKVKLSITGGSERGRATARRRCKK